MRLHYKSIMTAMVRNEGSKMTGETKKILKKLVCVGMFALAVAGGVREAKGYTVTQLTFEPSYDGEPAWSPDGNEIAFVSDRDGNYEIYVMDANGSNQERLTYNIYSDRRPAWSPNGVEIAFVSNRGGASGLYLMKSDGSNQRRLIVSEDIEVVGYPCSFIVDPAWSPDGSKIVFSAGWALPPVEPSIVSDLFILELATGILSQFTNGPYSGMWPDIDTDSSPSWSPDGDKVVYVSKKPGGGIKVKNISGSEYSVFYTSYLLNVEWSPRVDFFTFSNGGGGPNIYILPVQSETGIPIGEPVWLTYGLVPSWSPDGTKIAFFYDFDIWVISGIRVLTTDLYHDGIVNLLDFSVFADCWRQDDPLADIAQDGGDGVVDFLDLAKLSEEWLETEEWYPQMSDVW